MQFYDDDEEQLIQSVKGDGRAYKIQEPSFISSVLHPTNIARFAATTILTVIIVGIILVCVLIPVFIDYNKKAASYSATFTGYQTEFQSDTITTNHLILTNPLDCSSVYTNCTNTNLTSLQNGLSSLQNTVGTLSGTVDTHTTQIAQLNQTQITQGSQILTLQTQLNNTIFTVGGNYVLNSTYQAYLVEEQRHFNTSWLTTSYITGSTIRTDAATIQYFIDSYNVEISGTYLINGVFRAAVGSIISDFTIENNGYLNTNNIRAETGNLNLIAAGNVVVSANGTSGSFIVNNIRALSGNLDIVSAGNVILTANGGSGSFTVNNNLDVNILYSLYARTIRSATGQDLNLVADQNLVLAPGGNIFLTPNGGSGTINTNGDVYIASGKALRNQATENLNIISGNDLNIQVYPDGQIIMEHTDCSGPCVNPVVLINGDLHVDGDITATGTITPSVPSDRRLKTDITQTDDEVLMDLFERVNVYDYGYIPAYAQKLGLPSNTTVHGFISNEIREIFGDKYTRISNITLPIVGTNRTEKVEIVYLDKAGLLPYVWGAAKNNTQEIRALKERVTIQEARIITLETQVASLLAFIQSQFNVTL